MRARPGSCSQSPWAPAPATAAAAAAALTCAGGGVQWQVVTGGLEECDVGRRRRQQWQRRRQGGKALRGWSGTWLDSATSTMSPSSRAHPRLRPREPASGASSASSLEAPCIVPAGGQGCPSSGCDLVGGTSGTPGAPAS